MTVCHRAGVTPAWSRPRRLCWARSRGRSWLGLMCTGGRSLSTRWIPRPARCPGGRSSPRQRRSRGGPPGLLAVWFMSRWRRARVGCSCAGRSSAAARSRTWPSRWRPARCGVANAARRPTVPTPNGLGSCCSRVDCPRLGSRLSMSVSGARAPGCGTRWSVSAPAGSSGSAPRCITTGSRAPRTICARWRAAGSSPVLTYRSTRTSGSASHWR